MVDRHIKWRYPILYEYNRTTSTSQGIGATPPPSPPLARTLETMGGDYWIQ